MNLYLYKILVSKDAIDLNLHVNNAQYVQWMQDAAMNHSNTVGDTLEVQQNLGFMWVVKSHNIEYLHPAYEGEKLHVKTLVKPYKKSASLREYEFYNEKKQLLVKANTIYVCLNTSTLRPMKIPENIAKLYL